MKENRKKGTVLFLGKRPFIDLVAKILAMKAKNPESDTSILEHQIDEMVYELYGLTEKEIKIVEMVQ